MKTIFVIGASAVGKSVVRRAMASSLRDSFPRLMDLGVDDILRKLHAEGLLDGLAELTSDNALLLNSWEETVSMALTALLDMRASHDGPAVIEVPLITSWISDVLLPSPMLSGSLVIYLHADLHTRMERNEGRQSDRISRANLKAMPERLPSNIIGGIVDAVACWLSLSTESRLEFIKDCCSTVAMSYMEHTVSAASG